MRQSNTYNSERGKGGGRRVKIEPVKGSRYRDVQRRIILITIGVFILIIYILNR